MTGRRWKNSPLVCRAYLRFDGIEGQGLQAQVDSGGALAAASADVFA
jgi:hypothetical protein